MELNEELVKTLIKKHLTISLVESFTGGMAAKEIVDISGSSNTFLGSIVSYSTFIKETVLKIDKEKILKYGVASKEIAEEMAKKGKEIFNSDIVISYTGEAGPISSSNVKAGTVFISIIFFNELETYKLELEPDRNSVRKEAIRYSFEQILNKVKEISVS